MNNAKMVRNGYTVFKKLVEITVIALFSGITLITMGQVFFRYVLNAPLMWTEELARYFFVWGVLLAAGLGLSNVSHIGVEIIVDKLPPRFQSLIRLSTNILMGLFSVFLIYYGWQLVEKVMHTASPALKIPMSYVYAAVPVSAMVWLVFLTSRLTSTDWLPDDGRLMGDGGRSC